MKMIIFMFAFMASVAYAEDRLELNPLGLTWGATVQEARLAYPDGIIWPVEDRDAIVAYSVSKEANIYWAGIPVEQATLYFTAGNKLCRLYIGFDYLYSAQVKQKSMAVFGNSERVRDENSRYVMNWDFSQKGSKSLSINSAPVTEWAYISVRLLPDDDKSK